MARRRKPLPGRAGFFGDEPVVKKSPRPVSGVPYGECIAWGCTRSQRWGYSKCPEHREAEERRIRASRKGDIVGECLPPVGEPLPPAPIGGVRLHPDKDSGGQLRAAVCTGIVNKGGRAVRQWRWM